MSEDGRHEREGALVLFTRDLRVRDHAALKAATSEHERVVTAFVFDEAILTGTHAAPNRLAFLLDCLADLGRSLAERGGALVIRRGDVVEQTMRLVGEHGLSAIHMSADHTPYARERHDRLQRACSEERVRLETHAGVTFAEPGAITPTGGDHYRVFTPYWRVWKEIPQHASMPAPRKLSTPRGVRRDPLPKLAQLTDGTPSHDLQQGGETQARAQLERWLPRGVGEYAERNDDLAGEATSRLSAYLHFGCLAPATVLSRLDDREGGAALARQLCWRDFHHQVLAARRELPSRDYRPRGDRWSRNAANAQAWRDGLTGYPIVDAGMRQLASEGFMHNRARLIVGSFLTKTLYIDWRLGAAHFAGLLLDADVANNVGNWQWIAGTGNDTRPNRVLNPLRQARRFDPDGEYVRRHVPELAGVSGAAVHEPWRLGKARELLDYPDRIIDHELGAARFLEKRG